jgi:hypothetical protein
MANPPGEVTARLGEMKLSSKDALTRLIPTPPPGGALHA